MSATILQFPARKTAPIKVVEPSHEQVTAALIAVLVCSLPASTRTAFRRRFQKAYDNAQDPAYRAALKVAANSVFAPLMAH